MGKSILTALFEFGKYELFYPVRRLVKNLKRAYEYSKQGYDSYDWDAGYLINDIIFKIKRLKKFFKSTETVTNDKHCKQCIKEMEEVLVLLERISDDPMGLTYYSKYEKQLEKKYGKLRRFVEESDEKQSSVRVLIQRDKETFKNTKEIQKAQKEAWKKALKERESDKKKAFTLIAKYFDAWWD